MSVEEVKQVLHELDYDETVVFENPDYVSAIVGIDSNGRLIYSWDKMIEHLKEVDGMEEEDAIEFISYNTERALPYAGEMAPIIMYPIPYITEE